MHGRVENYPNREIASKSDLIKECCARSLTEDGKGMAHTTETYHKVHGHDRHEPKIWQPAPETNLPLLMSMRSSIHT